MENIERIYEELFTRAPEQTATYHGRASLAGIAAQRVRTVHAGNILMVDSYPVYHQQLARYANSVAAERRKRNEYTEAQRRVDANRARKRLIALANANFGPGDIIMTLTWRTDDPGRPGTAKDAKKQMDNYILRVRRMRQKRDLKPMRYIYVVESTNGPKHGPQHHIHLLTGGDGVTELELRSLWRAMHKDARVQTDTVWQRAEGLTKWAGYVTKGEQPDADKRQKVETCKRWYASRGLKRPTVSVADKKLTKTKAERMAADFDGDGRRILEKLYKGYKVLEIYVRTSEWLPGAYIYATLAKDEDTGGGKRCLTLSGCGG